MRILGSSPHKRKNKVFSCLSCIISVAKINNSPKTSKHSLYFFSLSAKKIRSIRTIVPQELVFKNIPLRNDSVETTDSSDLLFSTTNYTNFTNCF